AFFEAVQRGLAAAGVAFVRALRLVRGFDYYRHTAFEFVTDRLGAQGTVIGGGRYDGLIEAMGGPPTPAVGWAGGIERLMALSAEPPPEPLLAVIPETAEAEPAAARVALQLRRAGIATDFAFRGNQKRRRELAARAGATDLLFVRPGEALELNLVGDYPDESAQRARAAALRAALPEAQLLVRGAPA
ncbi:MAG: ATP phosphoribosyltransferase regulatory subunit, partial [Thermaurantiacus tibetensis]